MGLSEIQRAHQEQQEMFDQGSGSYSMGISILIVVLIIGGIYIIIQIKEKIQYRYPKIYKFIKNILKYCIIFALFIIIPLVAMKDLPVQGKIMLFIILGIIVYTIRDFIKGLHLKREEEPYQEFEDTDRDEESY